MKEYIVRTFWGEEKVTPIITRYANNKTLAVQLMCEDGPFATLTVNLPESKKHCNGNRAFVDVNNCPWACDFLESNELAKPLYRYGFSGFCTYPLYEFNLDKLKGE